MKRKEKKQKPKRGRCNGTNFPCEVKEDATPFPACFADKTYYQTCLSRDRFRSRWTPSRKDNAISSFFAKIPYYLCTVSIRKQTFNSRFWVSYFESNYVYGHVSWLTDLSERRLVAFLNSAMLLAKFSNLRSSCCIYIKPSAVFGVSIST